MKQFEINDIVIITKNPPNQIVKIKGDVGYISEYQELQNDKGEPIRYVYFKTIELNSFCGGMGSIPIDCIEHYNDEKYNRRLAEIFEYENKLAERNRHIQHLDDLKGKQLDYQKQLKNLKKERKIVQSVFANNPQYISEEGKITIENRLKGYDDEILEIQKSINKIEEELNTPFNKRVVYYLDWYKMVRISELGTYLNLKVF